jgi:hypothetical protein
MTLDIYYATSAQDKFGKKNKTWNFDSALKCYIETVGSEDDSKTFFEYKDKLIGRTKVDPRKSSAGQYYPITDIAITNIRDTKTSAEFYIETAGQKSGESSIYELSAVEPYVNPWNEIEYYRVFLTKMDAQEGIS